MSDAVRPESAPALECRALKKSFLQGKSEVPVLSGITFRLGAGESLAIIGASGSGKSTLLHLLGGLESPDQGEVFLMGEEISKMPEAARSRWRNRHLGFIYQFHHLLPEFSALDNVAMPLMIRRIPGKEARLRAKEALTAVGLGERLTHRPGELSGGERQRAAVARALAAEPALLLADEPTGNLDSRTAAQVFALMAREAQRRRAGMIVVTHDIELACRMDRVLRLSDGVLLDARSLPR
ncbi:MAG: ATP-binding cassette domain-containing protein [Zoogloeaceae bacterium]|jgi:lipoprotein-releasing system ATP-binding protein|nr:ATP-binding cassette domain-containing protein [Zoogloeaceae bacterium]